MQQPAAALSISFHLCAHTEDRVFGGNAMLTLEKRCVTTSYCVAEQLLQTSQTNARCIIQNILHYSTAFPHASSIPYQSAGLIFKAFNGDVLSPRLSAYPNYLNYWCYEAQM